MCVFNSPFDSCMHLNLFFAPIVYLIMLTLIRTYVYNKINEFAHEEFILLLDLFEITQINVWVGIYLYSILSCSTMAIIQLPIKLFLDFPLGTFAGIELLIHISHMRQRIKVLKIQIQTILISCLIFQVLFMFYITDTFLNTTWNHGHTTGF